MIKHTKLKPSYIQAKRRTKEEVKILTDEYIMTNELKKLGLGKKYHIITYGCQGNVRDSETISAILEDMSFVNTENMEDADLILLNTCAIRENAHNKVFGMLGRIKHLKETKPEIITILCGCMAQEESVVNEIEKDYKWMDVVFGTHNIQNLPKLLSEAMDSNELIIEVFSKEGDIIENLPVKRDNKYKAFVNIMYGCDKFCTYCIVPFTRGKQRSRKEEDFNETLKVVDEVKYDGAFTFIYSPRENTPAAKMKDSIDLKTKQERLYKLNELVNKYSNESNNKLLDKVVPVLIEGPSTKGNNIYSGYTDTMKLVNVKCDKEDLGKIINVKITDAKSWSLNGEKVNE